MLDTSARLLRLLALLQGQRYWTGAELAERLEVTPRTVRRDVDRLRSLGYPVSSSVGVAGGYQLDVGATLPPLLLDDDEALAVAVGLRTVAVSTVSGAETAAVRALAKLERILPPKLRRRFRNMRSAVVPLHAEGQPQVDASLLTTLASASRDHQVVTFGYVDRQSRSSRRHVEPRGLVHTGSRWYLAAYDLGRDDWRTFRVDRVEGKAVLGDRFEPRELPDRDTAAYVARSIGPDAYSHRARVVIHAPRQRVEKKLHPSAGSLESLSKRRCRLEAGADSLPALAWYLASLGEEFEVQHPPELVAQIDDMAGRLSRAAARS